MRKSGLLAYARLTLVCLGMAAGAVLLGVMAATVETVSPAERVRALPVVLYCNVADNAEAPAITPRQLAEDLFYLRENGYTAIGLRELIACREGKLAWPEKPILLTFDGGYYSHYTCVYPLLQRHNMKAVFSIVGRYASGHSANAAQSGGDDSYMNWEQLREVRDSGLVEIASHSYDLHDGGLRRIYRQTDLDYRQAIWEDVSRFRETAEAGLGGQPICFVYPEGFISREAEEILRETGFLASLGMEERINRISGDPGCLFNLGRYARTPDISMEKFLQTMADAA